MIFLTVGTYPLPFDRLIRTVDNAVAAGLIAEDIFAQIGLCKYLPQNIKYERMLKKEQFDKHLKQASGIIAHAGIGTITMALNNNKPLVVMPRMKCLGEHVNDHQVSTAKKYQQLGHVLVAHDQQDLTLRVEEMKTFVPLKRNPQPESVSRRIADFLAEIGSEHKAK